MNHDILEEDRHASREASPPSSPDSPSDTPWCSLKTYVFGTKWISAGKKLPAEFWEPNEYGVKGGIENAFMSSTEDRDVAMGYAAGDGEKMGIVLEVQQGMVNRGADLSWLSQVRIAAYTPHAQRAHASSYVTALCGLA